MLFKKKRSMFVFKNELANTEGLEADLTSLSDSQISSPLNKVKKYINTIHNALRNYC